MQGSLCCAYSNTQLESKHIVHSQKQCSLQGIKG